MMLSRDPNIMGGQLCIAGTRIPVRAIKSFIADGYSPEQVKGEYPSLTLGQIKEAATYTTA